MTQYSWFTIEELKHVVKKESPDDLRARLEREQRKTARKLIQEELARRGS